MYFNYIPEAVFPNILKLLGSAPNRLVYNEMGKFDSKDSV